MDTFFYKEPYEENGKTVLEVNLFPDKYCNFNCIFCPVSRKLTHKQTAAPVHLEDVTPAIRDLRQRLHDVQPDLVFINSLGEALLLPTDSLFADSPILLLKTDREEKRVRCGNPITMPGIPDGTYRVYGQDRTFLCLSRAENGTLTSIKNFFGA